MICGFAQFFCELKTPQVQFNCNSLSHEVVNPLALADLLFKLAHNIYIFAIPLQLFPLYLKFYPSLPSIFT